MAVQVTLMLFALSLVTLNAYFVLMSLLRPASVTPFFFRHFKGNPRVMKFAWRFPLYRWLAPGETWESFREKGQHRPNELPRLLLVVRLFGIISVVEVAAMVCVGIVLVALNR